MNYFSLYHLMLYLFSVFLPRRNTSWRFNFCLCMFSIHTSIMHNSFFYCENEMFPSRNIICEVSDFDLLYEYFVSLKFQTFCIYVKNFKCLNAWLFFSSFLYCFQHFKEKLSGVALTQLYLTLHYIRRIFYYQYTVEPRYLDTRFSRRSVYHVPIFRMWFLCKWTPDFTTLNNFQLLISRRFWKIGHFPYVIELKYLREIFVIL